MDIHEIKERVAHLTPEERAELTLHLQQLDALDDPATMTGITRRLDDLEAGRQMVNEAELQARLAVK